MAKLYSGNPYPVLTFRGRPSRCRTIIDHIRPSCVYDKTMDDDFRNLKDELSRFVRDDSAGLSPREKDVVKLRFGLEDGKTRTCEEVGVLFGVSAARIRQVELKSIRKIRHLGDTDDQAGAMVPKVPLNPNDDTSVELPLPESPEDSEDEKI